MDKMDWEARKARIAKFHQKTVEELREDILETFPYLREKRVIPYPVYTDEQMEKMTKEMTAPFMTEKEIEEIENRFSGRDQTPHFSPEALKQYEEMQNAHYVAKPPIPPLLPYIEYQYNLMPYCKPTNALSTPVIPKFSWDYKTERSKIREQKGEDTKWLVSEEAIAKMHELDDLFKSTTPKKTIEEVEALCSNFKSNLSLDMHFGNSDDEHDDHNDHNDHNELESSTSHFNPERDVSNFQDMRRRAYDIWPDHKETELDTNRLRFD